MVFDEHGRILLIEFSAAKGKLAGYHNPPGGHIEHGEGIIENAEREIKEETGLAVSNTKLRGIIHTAGFFGEDVLLFITSSLAASGAPFTAGPEGAPRWSEIAALKDLKVFPDMHSIVKKIHSPHESDIFTAKSRFNEHGELIEFTFES